MSGASRRADATPSAWPTRVAVVVLALCGAGVAGYLTAVQVGDLHAWDPLFGSGSDRVLNSDFSRSLPIPDASLGLAAYLVEAVLGVVGGTDRWRQRPWLPIAFGLVAVGLAAAAVLLVLLQAFVVQAWCALCLLSTLVSLTILVVSRAHEALAAVGCVRAAHDRGAPLVRTLLRGPPARA